MTWLADGPIWIGVLVALVAGAIGVPIIGLYESFGGAGLLLAFWITARVFQKGIHDVAETARAEVGERTGFEQASTNPLPRVFHETTEEPGAQTHEPSAGEERATPSPGTAPRTPTVERRR